MPRLISLATYTVRVWDAEERENQPIANFGNGDDLLEFLEKSLSELKKESKDDAAEQQVLRVEELQKKGRTLFGLIETGLYGTRSSLLDVKTRAVVHRRKVTEADMQPFYFFMDLPDGPDEGILVLQRVGIRGIRKILAATLRPIFESQFPGYRLRFEPIVEPKEFEKYTKGKIESIHFVRFDIPTDITDSFSSGHKEKQGYAELVIHARRGSWLPLNSRLLDVISGKRKLTQFIALRETKFDYQDVKIRSRVGRVARTVDLAKLNRLRSYYDITDDVEVENSSGHPKFDSIHNLAKELAARIRNGILK